MEEFQKIISFLATVGIKILISIVVIIISFKIINLLMMKLDKKLRKNRLDLTISKVIISSFKVLLKVLIIIGIVGYLGVETASISAIVASVGVGISLAVQGTLSNFAGGVIIIIMRPFRLGDFIETESESGTVENIRLFHTVLVTPDNRVVLVPNGILASNVIINYSGKDVRRCDMVIRIGYDEDLHRVKEILFNYCINDSRFLNSYRPPFVNVGILHESYVEMYVRVWVKTEEYWTVYYQLIEDLKNLLVANGITLPYNQLIVNINQKA